MAKKANRKSVKKNLPERVQVKVAVDATEGESLYVNHAEIMHGRHEIIVIWAQVLSKISQAQLEVVQSTGELRVQPSVQLIFPPTLLPPLIRALIAEKENYEKEHGKIVDSEK